MTNDKQADDSSLLSRLETRLDRAGVSDESLLAVLDEVLSHFQCVTGTIHDINPADGMLRLRAQRGIPAVILDRVRSIPIGKGMAGIAAERREPVQVCNLQTDSSGVAKPAARETRMEGSIAVPMLPAGRLCGVMGVAKPVVYEFTETETAQLVEIANRLGEYLSR